MSTPTSITRRDAIARLALVMGGALIGGQAWLRGETLAGKTAGNDFTADDIALLDEIGDTIIPATDTPGAKAVGIGVFMIGMVKDCYDDAQHAAFKAGLAAVDAASRTKFGRDFRSASAEQRTALLNALDAEQRRHQAAKKDGETAHYFRMMKQLTLLGFFTSEIGATQVLRFAEVPGRYDGNAPYKKGDRAWFSGPSRNFNL
jgi:Gluconate 2-dehydrogenase subunit 3